jgi:hypothetical protein
MATNRRTDIFDCGIWDSFEKRRATHHHPGSAKPALQRIMLDECSLNRMQCVAMGKSLDRRDRARADINGKHHAGADSHALDPNGARRASAPVTAHLGSRHTQVYAQGLCQRGARLNLEGVLFSIQIQRNRDGTRTRFREGGLFGSVCRAAERLNSIEEGSPRSGQSGAPQKATAGDGSSNGVIWILFRLFFPGGRIWPLAVGHDFPLTDWTHEIAVY